MTCFFYDWDNLNGESLPFLQAVRKASANRNVSIVLVSGNIDKNMIHCAIRAGVSDFIIKPFSMALFHQKMTKLIGARRPHTVRETER